MRNDAGPSKFGLKESTIERINAIFAGHPQIEQVILYGSRAKGNYRHGSDIDLTIKGEGVTLSQLMKIETELDDLLLPYKIDLSLLHKINDVDLINHIKRVAVTFYDSSVERA
ncbi:MAG: hypothetical protein A2075_20520 [Geobacteraceae bacterium GWC2_58_44]|nr:MAG: hypothetical protein A2075_20520 [Geobacteraceae bacterium GWC2_58_44]HBG07615.1 hypothetical protein [Geobacter sp.]